jgi:uncharacterized protein YdcH (DUF465 family)
LYCIKVARKEEANIKPEIDNLISILKKKNGKIDKLKASKLSLEKEIKEKLNEVMGTISNKDTIIKNLNEKMNDLVGTYKVSLDYRDGEIKELQEDNQHYEVISYCIT